MQRALSGALGTALAMFLAAGALAGNPVTRPPAPPAASLLPAQYQQCEQRVGPFATQDRAWSVWREAQARGYQVSNGIYICWVDYTRAYCFNVFTC
ncbi:MAG TPA: hypothetical protein VFR34_13450 [Paracoccaceae bacterium]|nr:hypothetical protein [Paracoccaceae bacterium]